MTSATPVTYELESDACFGASRLSTVLDVDLCTQVDAEGFPFIGGRILKGLVDEQVAVILRALGRDQERWERVALAALGRRGAEVAGRARFYDARVPDELRTVAVGARLSPGFVTRAFTEVRAQTRMDEERGTAADHSLRMTRVLSAGTPLLVGAVAYDDGPLASADADARALLLCALSLVRRAGTNRSRGWGRLRAVVQVGDAEARGWRAPLVASLRAGEP